MFMCLPRSYTMYLFTPFLCDVHICLRRSYVMCLFTPFLGDVSCKALQGQAPEYLAELIMHYVPTRALRSQSQHLLTETPYKLKTYGGRSFACVAPRLWNSLPCHLRSATSLSIFQTGLKTFLFNDAYNV